VVPVLIENDIIYWAIELLDKSKTSKIHPFALEFAAAMLTNIIETPYTVAYLEQQPDLTLQVNLL
jgi:hypothetical protein